MKYIILVLLLCQLLTWSASGKCLPNKADIHRKKFFNYGGLQHTLTIESSQRTAHNITSHILLIFLEEVLGYTSVKIVYGDGFNTSAAVDRLSEIEKDDNITDPTTMINLEVLTTSNFNLHREMKVEDVGMLGPIGRFGWFTQTGNITWQTFQKSEGSQAFVINDKLLKGLAVKCNLEHGITENCAYVPTYCQFKTCATLLADHYGSTHKVEDHINSLKLYVRVVWLGSGLLPFLKSLPFDGPRLVLTWSPGEVTVFGDWYPVTFPSCWGDKSSPGCFYESRRIVKLVSTKVKEGARRAFEAVSDVSFHESGYIQLLQNFVDQPNVSHYDMACNWLNKNKNVWKLWAPDINDKAALTICGIFPVHGALFSAGGLTTAAKMAIDAVNANTSILPHYNLQLIALDGGCNADRVLNYFIDYILDSKRMVGILGPPCSDTVEPLLGMTKYFRTVVITYSAEGSIFSEKEQYSYFFRTIGENQQFKYVYLKLLKKLGWNRMAALTEDGQKYAEYLSHLQDMLQAHNLTFITHRKFPRNRANATMRTYLEDLQFRRARIIVADVHDATARSVMCEAYHQGMTAAQGYVWFLPHWQTSYWYDTDKHNRNTSENVRCNTSQMLEAIQGHFSLAHQYFASDEQVTHEGITVKAWKEQYKNKSKDVKSNSSDYAGFAYDAVWTYALALHNLYNYNASYLFNIHSQNATNKFVEFIKNTNFMGVSGRIQFLASRSRLTNITIMQWVNGSFRSVGALEPNVPDSTIEHYQLKLYNGSIKWFTKDGSQPSDGEEPPSCVFQGLADLLGMDCSKTIILTNVFGFGLLAILLVVAVAFTKHQYNKKAQKLQYAEDYMKSMGFDLLPNVSDFDKWEIPRECVVINRRLGEGAFGTVYGGEAHFEKEGWVAAAVKTLKTQSTTQVKLDFLCEAEVLKRLDHKNVVKLLGVCTRDEPVYTVMEFMLYNDVKTFLQNRRHLVSGRRLVEESNEVSNKKLTSIALDIARGLSYLSTLKYVHRDIACRNCLLNSARVAKIGDFGLARRMYDSDIYVFSRKGMLPIRWMAPESLADGLFTTKSDIWSYGVLLYEIITFGSYPFQGLSNNEVVDHVKAGHTVPIPKMIKPQLESLIKLCWNQDYKTRPDAAEIVVFLANNPRVLSPCLDGVSSCVPVEDAELLEVRPSLPASPFETNHPFFPGERMCDTEFEQISPPASPTERCASTSLFSDGAREQLLPTSKTLQISMSQLAPLASRTPSDSEL